MALLDQIMSMGKHQAKNFEETYASVKKLKKLADEYNKVSPNGPVEERIKVWAAWSLIDPVTKAKADNRVELKPAVRSFQAIRDYLEELYLEGLSNRLYSKIVGRGDAMDVSAVAPGNSEERPVETEKYSYGEWMSWQNGGWIPDCPPCSPQALLR